MEIGNDVQRLLRRHHEIHQAMRQPGGVRILEERELHAIRERLKGIPTVTPQSDSPLTSSMR
ncbi:MAG TPA: hypothetical protein VHZ99_12105 [Steroidobacteraceae bacterium]|jgi:hypothetical protein|nr:hypothetical protein [Steroidobacteraceae bacterium]